MISREILKDWIMKKMTEYEIVDVTPDNLVSYDLFCKKSKKKEPGYANKVKWYNKRFEEGLRIKLLCVDEGKPELVSRGFIEYIPTESGWRVVNAPDYMLIHCIWVVGKNKKKGYGSELLDLCVEDAKSTGKNGVAVVVSKKPWLPGPKLFTNHGFFKVDTAPPAFELMVKKFNDAPDPSFPTDWDKRVESFGIGLTIVHTPQCPYFEDAKRFILDSAKDMGMDARVVELKTSQEVQERSPTAYGVYGVVFNGKLKSYAWISEKDTVKLLENFIR
jgi:L-amino acid N-acyltransferase YncA